MKSITHTISGLASSLFLNVGLTQVAEKLDPVANHQTQSAHTGLGTLGTTACVPCHFTPRSN